MTDEVRLQLPSSLNADTIRALHSQLRDCGDGLLVLAGAPDVFCHGIDPDYLLEAPDAEADRAATQFEQCLALIRSRAAPAVAYVEGSALGGGVGLAAVCDIVIAHRSATFGLPELLFGFVPGIILPYLSERMSLHTIRRLAYLGAARSASEARDLGLVDECDDAGDGRALRRWLRTLSRLEPAAVAELRALLRDAVTQPAAAWKASCLHSSLRLQRERHNARALKRFLTDGTPPWELR